MIKIKMLASSYVNEEGETVHTEQPETPFPENPKRIVCGGGYCYVVEDDGDTDGIPQELLS